MAISREDVLHVAKLACLELSEAEVERMTRDLASILAHVAELSKVDTTNVVPTTHLAVERLPLNPDLAAVTLDSQRALAEARGRIAGGEQRAQRRER